MTRVGALLLGTMLAGVPVVADAQGRPGGSAAARAAAAAPAPRQDSGPAVVVTDPNALTIKSLRVEGAQRI